MSKSGITLISLVITIIILGLITTTVIFVGADSIHTTNKKIFFSEINQIQSLVADYKLRNNNVLSFAETNFDLSSLSTEEKQQFSGETVTSNKVKLYVIDLPTIDANNTTYGNKNTTDDVYMVSNETGKVYYKKGVDIDNTKYYTVVE